MLPQRQQNTARQQCVLLNFRGRCRRGNDSCCCCTCQRAQLWHAVVAQTETNGDTYCEDDSRATQTLRFCFHVVIPLSSQIADTDIIFLCDWLYTLTTVCSRGWKNLLPMERCVSVDAESMLPFPHILMASPYSPRSSPTFGYLLLVNITNSLTFVISLDHIFHLNNSVDQPRR